MYRNILIPVSFEADKNAEGAIALAQRLVTPEGTITCLHVLEQLPKYATQYLPADHAQKVRQDIEERLSALVQDISGAKVRVVEGHSARTILEIAEEDQCDLVIVASHRPGMQDYLLGSTAAKVVRHAQCAVHVLR